MSASGGWFSGRFRVGTPTKPPFAPTSAPRRGGRRPFPAFLVGCLIPELDGPAVLGFVDGDVGHRMTGRGAVPVPMPGRTPDDVAGADLDDLLALAPRPAYAARHDQRLTARVHRPGRACAGGVRVTAAPAGRLGAPRAERSLMWTSPVTVFSGASLVGEVSLRRIRVRRRRLSGWCRRRGGGGEIPAGDDDEASSRGPPRARPPIGPLIRGIQVGRYPG